MKAIEILFDANRGQYIPQNFAEEIDHSKFTGIESNDIETLLNGPEDEWYWEAWQNVLDNAEYTTDAGTWTLYQDGDVFLLNDDAMRDDEYREFYGEERPHDDE